MEHCFQWIASEIGVKHEECLMVGNDVQEDMVAKEIGLNVFLLTDCLLNKAETDISVFENGNFDDLILYLENLLK